MKKFFLIAGLSLICFPSFATSYRVGSETCVDFEAEEKAYYEEEGNIHVTLVYAICLLIKGEATNNPSDVTKGMAILHELSDQQSNVPASFYIAQYHFTEGTFKKVSDKNLNIALNYLFRTLAIINTFHNYPPPIYRPWEERNNIEVLSYMNIPKLYLEMFYLGVYGDYNLKLLNSDSYQGDRNLKTYPEHRKNIMSYIDSAIKYARECKSLPLKNHFSSDFGPYYKEICAMYEGRAKLFKGIQGKRELLLSEQKCAYIDKNIPSNCPKLDELDEELVDAFFSIKEEEKAILPHL